MRNCRGYVFLDWRVWISIPTIQDIFGSIHLMGLIYQNFFCATFDEAGKRLYTQVKYVY